MPTKPDPEDKPENTEQTLDANYEALAEANAAEEKANLPAVPEPSGGALALPTEDEWQGVDVGYMGHDALAPTLPALQSDMRGGGGWIDQLTGEKHTELDIVWLAWTESRAYWPLPFGKGPEQPDCRSNDTLVPDPASPDRQSDTCASCPHSKWTADEAPACSLRVNVLAYLVAERRLTRVSFGGTALKHVARYIGGLRAMVPPRPPMAFVTHVGLEEFETKEGKWLEPRFSVGAQVDRTEAAPLIALRDEFTSQWRSLLAEDLSRPDAGAENVRRGPGPFEDAVDVEGREAGDPGATEPDPLEEPF